jgi:putative transposase
VQETEGELRRLLRGETCRTACKKLECLLLYRTGKALSQTHAAQRVGADRNTVGRWLDTYRQKGLDALLASGRKHQRLSAPASGLTPQMRAELLQRVRDPQGGFCSAADAWRWLRDERGLGMGYARFHRLLRRELKLRLKVPRPVNVKKDAEKAALFQKKWPSGPTP